MTQFVYPQRFIVWRGAPISTHFTTGFASGAEPSATCTEYSTCILNNPSDKMVNLREILSFTVVLDSTERPQVGWAKLSSFPRVPTPDEQGVGQIGASVGIDFSRRGVYISGGAPIPLKDLSLQAGTTVTCERTNENYRWIVNGNEVAIVSNNVLQKAKIVDDSNKNIVPAISAWGEWHISHFRYANELIR